MNPFPPRPHWPGLVPMCILRLTPAKTNREASQVGSKTDFPGEQERVLLAKHHGSVSRKKGWKDWLSRNQWKSMSSSRRSPKAMHPVELTGLIAVRAHHGELWGRSMRQWSGDSLMVQWLSLWAPSAGGLGFNPWQGTSIHTLQLKILYAATKTLE